MMMMVMMVMMAIPGWHYYDAGRIEAPIGMVMVVVMVVIKLCDLDVRAG
jgi:hypothetical protein